MTTIYLMRHAKPDKNNYQKSNDELTQNKSIELSEIGIIRAKRFFEKNDINNVDIIYTSDYIRAINTAKILDKPQIIDERLGERIGGIPNQSITPNEYFYRQMLDKDYKFKNGESRYEIESRMYNSLTDILESNANKKVLVITHGTSMTFLLMKYCNVELTDINTKNRKITFNNKVIFDNRFDYLETFKLLFNGNNLINIESIGNINTQ